MTPSISICICTRNRPDELERTLASIAEAPVEAQVVVSDDSSDDLTEALVARVMPEARYVRGPALGLGPNRTSAVAQATGELVLFLDDDCRLDPGFFAATGRCRDAYDGDRDRLIVSGAETNDGRVVRPGDQTFLGFQSRQYADGADLNSIVINATVFPRSVFERHEFDPAIIYGYDEVDLVTRAVAGGYVARFCEGAVNHHEPSPVNRGYYADNAQVTRLYVTFKRYRHTERRPAKAAAFALVAPLHVLGWGLRTHGAAGPAAAWRIIRRAASLVRAYAADPGRH